MLHLATKKSLEKKNNKKKTKPESYNWLSHGFSSIKREMKKKKKRGENEKKKLKKRKAITRWVIERGISEDKLQSKVKKKSGCEPD